MNLNNLPGGKKADLVSTLEVENHGCVGWYNKTIGSCYTRCRSKLYVVCHVACGDKDASAGKCIAYHSGT